jgi:hypothetical protein
MKNCQLLTKSLASGPTEGKTQNNFALQLRATRSVARQLPLKFLVYVHVAIGETQAQNVKVASTSTSDLCYWR